MCGCRGVGCRVCEGIVDGITEVTIGTECPVDKLNYHLYYFNKTKCRGGGYYLYNYFFCFIRKDLIDLPVI